MCSAGLGHGHWKISRRAKNLELGQIGIDINIKNKTTIDQ